MTIVSEASTKPYLIRAIHEWCCDNGYRPYIAVIVDERTMVPREFVRNGEIVLNVSPEATQRLVMGNELIEFEARFNRVARTVSVPVPNVSAIYAAENGHGMAFEVVRPIGVMSPMDSPVAGQASSAAPMALPAPASSSVSSAADADASRVVLSLAEAPQAGDSSGSTSSDSPPPPPRGGRPKLTRIK